MSNCDNLTCIYMLCSTNPDNDVKYIGSTNNIKKRMYMHNYRNSHGIYPHIYNALDNDFYMEILEYVDRDTCKNDLELIEKEYILNSEYQLCNKYVPAQSRAEYYEKNKDELNRRRRIRYEKNKDELNAKRRLAYKMKKKTTQ